eukprot:g4661.t1
MMDSMTCDLDPAHPPKVDLVNKVWRNDFKNVKPIRDNDWAKDDICTLLTAECIELKHTEVPAELPPIDFATPKLKKDVRKLATRYCSQSEIDQNEDMISNPGSLSCVEYDGARELTQQERLHQDLAFQPAEQAWKKVETILLTVQGQKQLEDLKIFGITSRCAIATSKMIAIVKRKVAIKARDVVMVEEDAVAEHAVGVGVAVRFVVMEHAVRLVVIEHAVVVRDAEFERAEVVRRVLAFTIKTVVFSSEGVMDCKTCGKLKKQKEPEIILEWDNSRRYASSKGEAIITKYVYKQDSTYGGTHGRTTGRELANNNQQFYMKEITPKPLNIPATFANKSEIQEAIKNQQTYLEDFANGLNKHARVLFEADPKSDGITEAKQRLDQQERDLILLRNQLDRYESFVAELEAQREQALAKQAKAKKAEEEKKQKQVAEAERNKIEQLSKQEVDDLVGTLARIVKSKDKEFPDEAGTKLVQTLRNWYETNEYGAQEIMRLVKVFLEFNWTRYGSGLGTTYHYDGFKTEQEAERDRNKLKEALREPLEKIRNLRPSLLKEAEWNKTLQLLQ